MDSATAIVESLVTAINHFRVTGDKSGIQAAIDSAKERAGRLDGGVTPVEKKPDVVDEPEASPFSPMSFGRRTPKRTGRDEDTEV